MSGLELARVGGLPLCRNNARSFVEIHDVTVDVAEARSMAADVARRISASLE